jgi:hypothetical protein
VGDFFNRLALAGGEITFLQEPLPDGMLAFSPDERLIAYMSGSKLVVREASTAFDQPGTAAEKRPLPVEVVWPAGVSQIEWSADSSQIMVTIIVFDQLTCQITDTSIWAMDVATGAYTKLS